MNKKLRLINMGKKPINLCRWLIIMHSIEIRFNGMKITLYFIVVRMTVIGRTKKAPTNES